MDGYSIGYIERQRGGTYEGRINVEGIDLSPIEGSYFKEGGKMFLWLKRKPVLEYDINTMKYLQRSSEPYWECYLEKQSSENIAYKGEFTFIRFKFTITGIWDDVLGIDKSRLNLYVERMPRQNQTIINAINKRNKNN